MESKNKGSYEGWNNIWNEQSKDDLLNQMYTEETPTTIFQFWQRGYANDLLKLIEGKNYSTFCELGSGRGTTSMYLSKNGYTDITMVDLAKEGFNVAKYSFNHYGLSQPKMILADVENTNIAPSSFDCIYNIGLLEHFENPSLTLKETLRLLTPGGLAFMPIVPQLPFKKSIHQRIKYNPVSILKHFVKRIIGKKSINSNSILRTEYDKTYYKNICTDLGFKSVECIAYNPYWKVTKTGSKAERKMLADYIKEYNQIKDSVSPSFRTTDKKELCYLLICEK